MTAILYLDTETTGIDSRLQDVIQIGCVPIINGIEQKEFNQFCQPLNYNNIDQAAIDAHGITVDRMKTFQSQSKMLDSFIIYLKSFNTRFVLSGFNINFDRKFIGALFQRHGRNEDYRELFSNNVHDVYIRAKALKAKGKIASAKLGSVAEYLGVDLTNAHDALADIKATIRVDIKLSELLGEHALESTSGMMLPSFDVPEVPMLHVHSEYSVLDSATTGASWYKLATQKSISGVAFPDHIFASSLHMASSPPKAKDGKLKYPNVTPVPAISLWVTDNNLTYQLTAWATSNEGYNNLVKLASIGWKNPIDIDGDSTAGSITLDEVASHSTGVVFGSACDQGLLSVALDNFESVSSIKTYIDSVRSKVVNLWLELLPVDIQKRFDKLYGFTAYNTPKAIAVQNRSKVINKLAWQLKNEENYKLIISSIAHFIEEDDKIVQDCKMKNAFKDERYYWESRHQRSAKEQFAILESHLGEFSIEHWNECKANAEEIVALAKDIKIVHKYHLPKIEIPKTILAKTEDYDKQTYYLMMAKIKEHGRWNDSPEYISRFKKEIDVIWKNEAMNFIPYFLVYEDIGNYARSQGILQGLARGSAGGCLISYYLKITHLDPIACDLPFERFLSHARIKAGSWPDIDCLDGDTLISLSNGQKISIRELSNLHASDYPELLSLSTSGIIPQKPVLIFKKGQAEVVQYNFEDGSVLTCTADHRVLTKEVGYIEIQKAFENGYDIVDYR